MSFSIDFNTNNFLEVFKDYDYMMPPHPISAIKGVSSPDSPIKGTLLFFNKFNEAFIKKIEQLTDCVLLLHTDFKKHINQSQINSILIFCKNPRYEYARSLQYIINHSSTLEPHFLNHSGALISEHAQIDPSTIIEPFAVIYPDVQIGANCRILAGAILNSGTTLGDYCTIREHTVIGSCGFGVETDAKGNKIRIPHIGGVIIDNNVDIGAHCVICAGTITPTIIEHHVQISSFCQIAHNVKIGKNTLITAGVTIGGSTSIGQDSWLGLNSTIVDGATIGEQVVIGMGANVCHSVASRQFVVPEKSPSVPRKR